MADFLTRRTTRNPILRQTAQLPATAREAFGAGAGMLGLGGLFFRRTDVIREDFADEGFYIRLNPETGRAEKWDPKTGEFIVPDRVPAETLNERYKDLGLTFDRPMTETAARIMAYTRRTQMIREDVLSRAKGPIATLAGFGGSLVAMATDPLEVATAFIPFFGQGTKAAMLARMGAVRGRAAIGAAEGALGNLITEPGYFALSRQLQLDYTMADALVNVSFGAILGGAGGAVVGRLAQRRARVAAETAAARTEPPAGMVPTRSVTAEASARVLDPLGRDQKIEAYRAAMAQVVQGKTVAVEGAVLATPDRRQSLLEFIAARGGINDQSPTFRGEIERRGNPRIGIRPLAAKNAKLDLDDFAELAAEQGYIPRRDVGVLLDAVDRELGGQRQYARVDADDGADFDRSAQESMAAERELEDFDRTRQALDDVGIRDVPLEDIQKVQRIMVDEGLTADDAFERLAIMEEAPSRDYSGDIEAARAADEIENFDALSEDNDDLMAMFDNMRDAGRLPAGAEEALAEADAFTRQAKAMGDTARVAAACLAR